MNCFIFRRDSRVFPEICGIEPLHDLALHLRHYGVKEIYSDSRQRSPLVTPMKLPKALPVLGKPWIAAYEGIITRQSPLDLLKKYMGTDSDCCLSLACSGKPWKHLTVLTGPKGEIQSFQANPPPENAVTNLCFSGLAIVGSTLFDPNLHAAGSDWSAYLIEGYWSTPSDREDYLQTAHDILSGKVSRWQYRGKVLEDGVIPANCVVRGTLWLGEDCSIGENCTLENCVIMDGACIGGGSSLRNCLVDPGVKVKPGTIIDDKYLTLLGEE